MHDKFRKAGGWIEWGSGAFRVPIAGRKTGPCEEPMHALMNATLDSMLKHPEYHESGVAILEMGVADGKVRKRVSKRTGLVSYSYALMAAKPNAKRG